MTSGSRAAIRESRLPISQNRLQEYTNNIQLMYDDVEAAIEALTYYGEPVIFKGAPGVGKTTSLFKVAYKKTELVTYLAGRRDLYEAAKKIARDAGFTKDDIAVAPSPFQACPTFRGDHGDRLEGEYKDLYSNAVSAAYLHNSDSIPSPCHNVDTPCPYMDQRIGNPDEYDVIIGHYRHAYNPEMINERITFVDEFPGDSFTMGIKKRGDPDKRIGPTLDGYFTYAEFLPWDSFEDFISNIDRVDDVTTVCGDILEHPNGGDTDGLIIGEKELLSLPPENRFHRKAPTIVFGLLLARDLGNGWWSWSPPDIWARENDGLPKQISVVRNAPESLYNLEVYLHEPPDLSPAAQVIGLDGTARNVMWDTVFQQDFTVEEFIPSHLMAKYVRDVQKMRLRQSTEAARPYGSGNYVSPQADAATILYTKLTGGPPVVITTKKAIDVLREKVPNTLQHDMKPVSITKNGSTSTIDVLNFAKVHSNNAAAGTEAICVLGSPNPGDEVIKRWGALMGESVDRRGETRGTDVVFDPVDVGQEIYGHFVTDVVEQAIMRGRRGDGDQAGSTVVVGTGCVPEWFNKHVGNTSEEKYPLRSEKRRRIIRQLTSKGEMTSTEIVELAELSGEGRRQAMSDFGGLGWVSSERRSGRSTIYSWEGI